MKRTAIRGILTGASLVALLSGGVAWADVKGGVDAWSRGDYAAAVHEWRGPATVGDPDALFNLGQAYRLGRGVPQDPAKAEELYARAAAKGHLQAADTYGLMLFQDGRREAALPYLQDAVRRGDPRAEYLLGIAHFNGDAVPKDWVRAYALVTLANQHSLPQAAAALAQMDQFIPLEQRQQAQGVAVQLEDQANATRGRALAAADLGAAVGSPAPAPSPAAPVSSRAPHGLATLAVSPSVAAALEAVAQARQAAGTESPAEAGARFARRSSRPVRLAVADAPAATPKSAVVATATPKPVTAPPKQAAATPQPAASPPAANLAGSWRIQLGAFAVHDNADKLWSLVSGRSELAGKAKIKVPAGSVVKLQAAGYPTRVAAEDACQSLRHAGHDCLVTR